MSKANEPVTRFFIRYVFGDGIAVWDNQEKRYATALVKDRGNIGGTLQAIAEALEAIDAEMWERHSWRFIVEEVVSRFEK